MRRLEDVKLEVHVAYARKHASPRTWKKIEGLVAENRWLRAEYWIRWQLGGLGFRCDVTLF